ncbi:MAG TPA: MG2 domain-containing protein, partial [Flavitalea sp.]|nr:MG2 domain-containing protein [Flavitalea sp.]
MRLLLFTLSFLILISCNQNSVALEKTNAKGEVPVLGNLSFRFSNALVTDSMLNQWDSTEFISFTPTIPGRFRWEQPDLLIFSPSRPLAPATTYSARLKQALLQNSSFGKIARADDVKFNTPAVQLEDAQIHWTLEEGSGRAIAESILYFNYPVPVNSLREKLILTLDEKQIPYTIQTRSGSNTISLLLQGLNPVDKDLEGKFHIAKGLLPEGGTEGSTEDIEIPARLPSPFNLVISDMTGTHDGINGTVVVRTSQPVDPEGIASLVKITPAVKFSIASNDEGFSVKSTDFNSDKSYLVSLSSGIRGRVGGKLQEQYDNNVSFGELQPQLKFAAAKSVYLSSASNRMIELRIVNVPKIKVIISKVYESNLLASQAYGYYPRDDRSGSDEEYYGENDYASADQSYTVGEVVYEKEIETRTLPQLGKNRLFAFNIEDRLPDLKGIYHIKIRSASEYWTEDSRFISVSDLGLIAREGRDKLYVFVNSVKTAKEISGVNVIAYGANNQVLGMAATNEAGVAEIGYTRKEFAGFRPSMIVAKSESDFNFLPLKTTAVNTSRFEVGGKRINSTGLDAFIYGERDIYRPGEEIHFSAIVRNSQWKSPGQLPVRFRMVYPNGKEMKVFRKTLNDQGSAEGMIDLPASAITGSYNLELYTSTDVLMGSYQFRVEEFVPDRIRVGVTIDNKDLEPGQPVKLSLDAANFFGPPAADRKYESEIQLSPKFFQPKKFPRYNFAIQNQGLSLDKVVKEGRTDGEGKATVNYEVPALFKNTGILRATFYTTVFDETGRPVSKGLSADVYTQPVFYGIGDDGNWYYPLNQPISFPLIALDKKEMPVSGTVAKVEVIRHEYRTMLAKSGSYFRYQSQEEEKIIVEQDLTINNESTKYSFIPRAPGNYEIRVTARGASAYVVRKFYSYGSWGGDNNSFEVDTEGSID